MEKGYCRNLPRYTASEQEAALLASGLKAKDIYIEGRNSESLKEATRRLDGGHILKIAADARVFGWDGENFAQARLFAAMKDCEKREIKVVDITHPEDDTYTALTERAKALAAKHARWAGSKKTAKKTGALGGIAKGISAMSKRLAPELAIDIWAQKKLTIKERLAIMPGWSESAARRFLE